MFSRPTIKPFELCVCVREREPSPQKMTFGMSLNVTQFAVRPQNITTDPFPGRASGAPSPPRPERVCNKALVSWIQTASKALEAGVWVGLDKSLQTLPEPAKREKYQALVCTSE